MNTLGLLLNALLVAFFAENVMILSNENNMSEKKWEVSMER